MIQDKGIYILVTPSEKDVGKEEYRVAYLDSSSNITWAIDRLPPTPEAINPTIAAIQFSTSLTFTDKLDAEEQAYVIADTLHITAPSIYHIYISTPFSKWSNISYV
jgi:hypothetical protein